MTTNRPFADAQEIASLIDHTLLKPDATETDIIAVCGQALEFRFASVCVNPCWVKLVHSQLRNSMVKTCTVVGFPLGANRSDVKTDEAGLAIEEGASEIDMVINVGSLRSGDTRLVGVEMGLVAEIAHSTGAILKVILETCLLNDQQKVTACELAMNAGADFVKTSTGFSGGGATEADVRLLRATVGPNMGVKASGGVRTLASLLGMVEAGATRIGSSAGVAILGEFRGGVSVAGAGVSSRY